MITKALFLLLLLSCCYLVSSVHVNEAPPPVCHAQNKNPIDCNAHQDNNDDDESGCGIYLYDYHWVLAGRDYARNEVISLDNLVVPFTQHSRRGFPLWNRHHLLWKQHNASSNHEFVFAPGRQWPLQCHNRLYNVKLNRTTYELTTDRPIRTGDALFVDCTEEDLSAHETLDDFLTDFPDMDNLRNDLENIESAFCLDNQVRVRSVQSQVDTQQMGVFAMQPLEEGQEISFSPLLHLHRAEVANPETGRVECDLLHYCFGQEDSDVLFLPHAPTVNHIRGSDNKDQANVKIVWDHAPEELEEIFKSSKFAAHEWYQLWVRYVTTRPIESGKELLLEESSAPSSCHERPLSLLHDKLLENTAGPTPTDVSSKNFPHFDNSHLQPGEVQHAMLEHNREHLGAYQHRVGLPPTFADQMEQWGEDTGITDILRDHVLGEKALPIDTYDRVRIDGNTWWIRRFGSDWKSDMHYITPDDNGSNDAFMEQLARAGFDEVLAGIGEHFGLESLSCFYVTYIAVRHCVQAYMHSDSDDTHIFNLILPVHQVEGSDPELVLGADHDVPFHVPYRYERQAGILVGKDGQHGTAPVDYRGTGDMRMVASIYMGDFNKSNVGSYVRDWQDPPYPNYERGQLAKALLTRKHWVRDDPSVNITSALYLSDSDVTDVL